MQRKFSSAELNYSCWNLTSKSGLPCSLHCFTTESELCQVFVPLSGWPSEVWLQTHLAGEEITSLPFVVPEPLVVPLCRTCFGQLVGPSWHYGKLALVKASHLLTRRWVPPTPRGLGCEPCTGFSGCKAGIRELPPMALMFPLSFALVPFFTARSPVPYTEIPSLASPGQSEQQSTNFFLFAFSACDSRA